MWSIEYTSLKAHLFCRKMTSLKPNKTLFLQSNLIQSVFIPSQTAQGKTPIQFSMCVLIRKVKRYHSILATMQHPIRRVIIGVNTAQLISQVYQWPNKLDLTLFKSLLNIKMVFPNNYSMVFSKDIIETITINGNNSVNLIKLILFIKMELEFCFLILN